MASWHTRVVPHVGWPEQPGAIHAGLSSLSLCGLSVQKLGLPHSMVVLSSNTSCLAVGSQERKETEAVRPPEGEA